MDATPENISTPHPGLCGTSAYREALAQAAPQAEQLSLVPSRLRLMDGCALAATRSAACSLGKTELLNKVCPKWGPHRGTCRGISWDFMQAPTNHNQHPIKTANFDESSNPLGLRQELWRPQENQQKHVHRGECQWLHQVWRERGL